MSFKTFGLVGLCQFALNIGVLVLFLFIFEVRTRAQSNNIDAETCLQQTCVTVASSILGAMDQSIAPCDNFYQYACKGWIENNRIPDGRQFWDVLSPMEEEAKHFVKDVLENNTAEGESQDIRLARTYYKSCVNKSSIENRGVDPILTQITDQFHGWTLLPSGSAGARSDKGVLLQKDSFNLAELYLPLLVHFHYTPLFDVDLGFDPMNISHWTLELAGYVLDENVISFISEETPAQRKDAMEYKYFMRNYSAMLGVSGEYLAELDAIYEFEKTIAQHIGEINSEEYYETISVKNIAQRCPVMDWLWLFNQLYAPINHTISEDDEISLNNYVDFGERCDLYANYLANETGIRILHNAAVWQFLWKTRETLPGSVLGKLKNAKCVQTPDHEVRLKCARETYNKFTSTVDRYFVKEKLDERNREYVNEMTGEIKEALMENLANSTWLEKEDKTKVLKKLGKLKAVVGNRNIFDGEAIGGRIYSLLQNITEHTYLENFLQTSRLELSIRLSKIIGEVDINFNIPETMVNAHYNPYEGSIHVQAGFIQKPFLDADYPMAVNYGWTGWTVGHELTHAFDAFFIQYDHDGIRPMIAKSTQEMFDRKSQCLVEQYSSYSVFNLSIDGNRTLSENIADNGGLKATFKAFKKRQALKNLSLGLPGVNVTSDQLFFISLAQSWCSKAETDHIERNIFRCPHTLDEYRIIGMFSNSEEFARTFNCPVGSRMNPREKCSVW